MCYLLMASVSTNPTHNPEFLGALCDIFITTCIVYLIVKRIKERRTQ